MALLSWRKDYQVGIPLIDSEHKYLFGLINEFHEKYTSGSAHQQQLFVLNRLVEYAERHFQHEEALMAETGYPRLAHQQEMHESLYSSIFALHEQLSLDAAMVDAKTLHFLKHWLLDHILADDLDIGDYLRLKAAQEKKVASEEARKSVADKAAAVVSDNVPAETAEGASSSPA